MKEQEMYSCINKGVPNYVPININLKELLDSCASDKELFRKELSTISRSYQDFMVRQMGYAKYNSLYFTDFYTNTSFKNSTNYMFISPLPFIVQLKEILGVSNPSADYNDYNLKQELDSKVELLKDIKNEEELKEKFPLIHADYLESKRRYAKKISANRFYSITGEKQFKDEAIKESRIMRRFGLTSKFPAFMDNAFIMYHNMVKYRQFAQGYCTRNPIPLTSFEGLDKDKFELFLAYKYLDKALNTEDEEVKQRCLYYIATYIRETKISNLSITVNNKELSFVSLLRKYKKLLRTHTELKPIDEDRSKYFNLTFEHSKKKLEEYLGSRVLWKFIPSGEPLPQKDKVIEGLSRMYNHLSDEDKKEAMEKAYALYQRKVDFFENSGYAYKIYGIDEFSGYIAYIYNNGEIILEKLFKDQIQYLPATDEAIYNIKVADFKELSKLSKSRLIKDSRVRRVNHINEWEERTALLINAEPTEESIESVKELVKEYKPITK